MIRFIVALLCAALLSIVPAAPASASLPARPAASVYEGSVVPFYKQGIPHHPTIVHQTAPAPRRAAVQPQVVSSYVPPAPVAQAPVQRVQAPTSAAAAWAAGPIPSRIRWCESRDNYATDTGNGYYGAYQMDPAFWASYGGGAANAAEASPAAQDEAAYRGWRALGWAPWYSDWANGCV